MSWQEIVKYKGRRRSERALNEVDKLMSDSRPRTARKIIEELFTILPKSDMKGTRTLSRLIPTERELKYYLGRDSRYTSELEVTTNPDGSKEQRKIYQFRGE